MQYNLSCVNFFLLVFTRNNLTKLLPFNYILNMSTCLHMTSIFDDIIQRLNTTYTSEVRSCPTADTLKPVSGYVHLLDGGNALLITDERHPYLITLEFVIYYHLKTGDRIQARVSYDVEYDNFLVKEVIDIQHVAYDEAPAIKADRTIDLFGNKINLGTSVMVPVGDNTDIANKVSQIIGILPADVVPMFLSFDGRPTNFDVPNACYTKPSYSSREKLMACLLTFFQAKQQADVGKDVVLVIDTLDKMFFAFNNCMQSAGMIDPNLFSSAALTDYENILCTTGNLQAGGSFTIIGLHHTGNSSQLLQINDRLQQIMDQVVEIK